MAINFNINNALLTVVLKDIESMKPSYPQSRYKAALKPINKTRNREEEAMPGNHHVIIGLVSVL